MVGGNWLLSTIQDVLRSVEFDGAANAISNGPRWALHSLAQSFESFQSWLADARSMARAHPALFVETLRTIFNERPDVFPREGGAMASAKSPNVRRAHKSAPKSKRGPKAMPSLSAPAHASHVQ
jgi:hypothetical protein